MDGGRNEHASSPPAVAEQPRGGALPSLTGRSGWLLLFLVLALLFCNWRSPLLKMQSLKRVDYLNFGVLYLDDGEYEAARTMLERSLGIDPKYGPAYEQMARLYQAQGQRQQALHYLELARRFKLGGQYQQGSPRATSYEAGLLRALEFYQEQDYAAALDGFAAIYAAALAEGDSMLAVRTLNNIGLCHYKLESFAEAEEAFLGIIQQAPTYVFAYRNLARVYRALGRAADADRLMAQAAEIERRVDRSEQDLRPSP